MMVYLFIFIFGIFVVLLVMYIVYTYVMPKKIDEIAKMIESGQTKLAIKKLNDLLAKDERNPHAHYLLGEAYLKDNNVRYAIIEFKQVVKIGRFDERIKETYIRTQLARLFKDINATNDAKKEFLILTTLEPDNFENYFELGVIFFNTNIMDKAISFFKKSVAVNPKHQPSYYFLGQIYYRNALYSESKQALVESIRLDGMDMKAHYFLGLVLRQMSDFEWAIKEFEIAQKSEDLKVKCFLAKGSCYMEKELHPKAIQEFERGLKYAKRGSDTELNLRYYLALSQEKVRDLHSAIYQWEKISEVRPDFKDVKDKLKTYAEFRQDDRIKDFLIVGLSQFEHICRKIVEAMSHKIVDVDIISDTDIEIIATDTDSKWRNTRQTNKIFRIVRTTDAIQEKYLRTLHETMRAKNAHRIAVITAGEFAQSAVDFANTRPIELYGKAELVNMLKKT